MNKKNEGIITVLLYVQIIFSCLGVILGSAYFSGFNHPNFNTIGIAMVAFAIGLVTAIFRMQVQVAYFSKTVLDNTQKTNELNIEAAKLRRNMNKIEQLRRVEGVFLEENDSILSDRNNIPQIQAYRKTGLRFGINNTIYMAKNFSQIKEGNSIIVEDPKLTEDFLLNIVDSIEEIGGDCIWLGTSKVYRPEGWKNKEINRFVTSLRAKSEKSKVKVYRTYMIDGSRSDIDSIIEKLEPVIEIEKRKNVITNIYTGTIDVSDMSILIAKLNDTSEAKDNHVEPPYLSRDNINKNGWQIIFALEWKIINGTQIGNVTVHTDKRKTIGFYDDFQSIYNASVNNNN